MKSEHEKLTAQERRKLNRKPSADALRLAEQFMNMSKLDTPEERERRVAALISGVEVVGAKRWRLMTEEHCRAESMAWLLGERGP